MSKQSQLLLVRAAALAVAMIGSQSFAGQLFTFENPAEIDGTHGTPETAYTFRDSYSGIVERDQSSFGATDGSFSMRVRDLDGGFANGTQVLFNAADTARFNDFTTATKLLIDVTAPQGLPDYQVTNMDINYGGGYLGSYGNPGKQYLTAFGPATQATPFVTQTYTWDFGGEMRFAAGAPSGLWQGLSDYVILHMQTNSGNAAALATYYYDNIRVVNEDTTVRPTWNASGTGDWNTVGSWANGIPNSIGAAAIFYGAGNGSVTVNSAVSVGSIIFDAQMTTFAVNGADSAVTSAAQLPPIVNYNVSGTGSITFDTAAGEAELYVIAGNHNVNVPVTLNDNLRINTSAGFGSDNNSGLPGGGRYSSVAVTSVAFGSTVTLTTGTTLTTSGAGSVSFNGAINGAGTLQLNGGKVSLSDVNVSGINVAPAARVTVAAGNHVLRTKSLVVGNGSLTSSLDIASSKVIVDYDTTSPLASLSSTIASGGINSSVAAADTVHLAIGYGEASVILGPSGGTFAGQAVDGTAILARVTLRGDASVDGKVDTVDFNRLISRFGTVGTKVWTDGDSNSDGSVNSVDFALLVSNFGATAPAGSLPGSAPGSVVPEPVAGALLLGLALVGRRKRRA